MKLCQKCNKNFTDEEFDNHINYCNYVPNSNEFQNLIPCEYCNNFINFDEYQSHISSCGMYYNYNPLNLSFLTNLNQNINSNLPPDSNTDNNINNDNSNEESLPNTNNQYFTNIIQDINELLNILESFPINNTDEYEDLTNLGEEIGTVNKEINLDDISKKLNCEIECPICMEKTQNNMITFCNHKFCKKCLENWISDYNKCPICMVELKKIN